MVLVVESCCLVVNQWEVISADVTKQKKKQKTKKNTAVNPASSITDLLLFSAVVDEFWHWSVKPLTAGMVGISWCLSKFLKGTFFYWTVWADFPITKFWPPRHVLKLTCWEQVCRVFVGHLLWYGPFYAEPVPRLIRCQSLTQPTDQASELPTTHHL